MSTVRHFKSKPGTIGEESFKVARVLKNRKRKKKKNLVIMYLTKMEVKLVLFI